MVGAAGSGRWCRESLESGDAGEDQPGPWGSVAEVEVDASGSSGDGGGDAEQPVAEPFRFPAAGFVTGQGEYPGPGCSSEASAIIWHQIRFWSKP